MRFYNAASVMKTDKGINLFDKKGKLLTSLDVSRHPLRFESTELFISTSLEGDIFGKKPFSEAAQKTTVHGKLKPKELNLCCFAKDHFLGEVKAVSFHCSESDEHHLLVRVWEPDGRLDTEISLHISLHLPTERFRDVFHPIWVRQRDAHLDLTLSVAGYQEGVEAAFGEIGDVDNIIVEADADIGAEVGTLRLTSQIQTAVATAENNRFRK